MTLSGVISRPYSGIPCYGFLPDSDVLLKEPSFSGRLSLAGNWVSGVILPLRHRDSKISIRPSYLSGSSGFSDNKQLQYYISPRCGGKKEKERRLEDVTINKKKMKKLIKGLSRDLLEFSGIGFGLESKEGLISEVREKIISETASVLLAQLQQLKAEEKEKKRKQKEHKLALKEAPLMKVMPVDNTPLSSSSGSSNSKCEEMVTQNCLGSGSLAKPQINHSQTIQVEKPVTGPKLPSLKDCKFSTTSGEEWAERIEVCMGGKCKKSGGMELLEELERMIGVVGAVVGCKCMGKCRDGPNVRVMNQKGEDSISPKTNVLCTGVGLEDLRVIVANFRGKQEEDMGLLAA